MNTFYWPTYSTLSGYIVLVFIYKCSTNLELSKYIIHSQAYLATFAYTKVKNSGKVFQLLTFIHKQIFATYACKT